MKSQNIEINTICNNFMNQSKEALAQIIVSIQSDQLLEQMRNDPNLYEEKLNYIKQLIKQYFIFKPIQQNVIDELNDLKQQKRELEIKIQESKQDYINQLQNIQVQYKQFLNEKQTEKKEMQSKIHQQKQVIQNLKKLNQQKISQIQSQYHELKVLNQSLQNQILKLKNKAQVLEKEKLTLDSNINFLKNNQIEKSKQEFLQKQNIILKEKVEGFTNKIDQLSTQINELNIGQQTYLSTIQNMKGDMLLIKQQWEKKCFEIESNLSEQYRAKLLQHEQIMNNQLFNYVEDLKMGKNIIIQSSEEILQSKVHLIQARFNEQLKRYEQDLQLEINRVRQLENMLKQMKNQKQYLSNQLGSTKKAFDLQVQENKQNIQKFEDELNTKSLELTKKYQKINQESEKQIERLRKTQTMLLKQIKTQKSEKESIEKEVLIIRQDFDAYKDKQMKQTKRIKQLEEISESSNDKLIKLKRDLAISQQKITLDEKTMKQKTQDILRLQSIAEHFKNDLKNSDNIIKKLQLKYAEANLKLKNLEQSRHILTDNFEKLYLLVRKLSKQLILIKQDIAFTLNIQKGKLSTFIIEINQQVKKKDEIFLGQQRLKIRELLSEFEQQRKQQKTEYYSLQQQNDNMRKEIKLLEKLLQQKQEQYKYMLQKTVSGQVERCRMQWQEDVAKQRQQKRKLQDKLYNNEKQQVYLLNRAQKEVGKNLRLFVSKWQSQVEGLIESLMIRDRQIKQLSESLSRVLSETEELKERSLNAEEKLTKVEKKYESLKAERDRTVDQMMKRLQKQVRHKLVLEKQVKQIRGQLVKTHTTATGSPFNNYSFTDRQNQEVYTNAFQATQEKKYQNNNTNKNHREKELSEIREMIAKTYKVMEGPEKDSPIHKGKLF